MPYWPPSQLYKSASSRPQSLDKIYSNDSKFNSKYSPSLAVYINSNSTTLIKTSKFSKTTNPSHPCSTQFREIQQYQFQTRIAPADLTRTKSSQHDRFQQCFSIDQICVLETYHVRILTYKIFLKYFQLLILSHLLLLPCLSKIQLLIPLLSITLLFSLQPLPCHQPYHHHRAHYN